MPVVDLRERDVDKWTLRQVVERGALAFECRKCWHLAQLDVLELWSPGSDRRMPVGGVRAKTVCRMCGGRRVRSLVRLRVGAGRIEPGCLCHRPRRGRDKLPERTGLT